jgi:hypothetical protein
MSRRLLLFVAIPVLLSAYSWVARYNGPADGEDRAVAMTSDEAGYVYVTGSSAGTGSGLDFLTVKYDPATGDTIWTRRWSSPGNLADHAVAIVGNRAGHVYVTGVLGGANTDFMTIKYSAATGDTIWTRRYDGPAAGNDAPAAICLDDSGSVYVAGYARVGGHSAATTVKYDAAGTQRWAAHVSLPVGDSLAVARRVYADLSRHVYVCGSNRDVLGQTDMLLAKLTPLGDTAWVRTYDGSGNDYASALFIDAGGNVIVAGSSASPTNLMDYLTIKYTGAGGLQWTARYDGTDHGFDSAAAAITDPAGNVYVTGQSYGASNRGEDFLTISYTPTGGQRWTARYNGPSNGTDIAHALARSPEGNITVTGLSESGNDYDLYTVQYDTAGGLLWSARYDYSPSHDEDAGLALLTTQPGLIYVTGHSFNDMNADFVTLKYLQRDVGVVQVNTPSGTLPPGIIVPSVEVSNYGVRSETLTLHVWVSRVGSTPSYYASQTLYGLAPGTNTDVELRYFVGDPGDYVIRCSVACSGDLEPANNLLSAPFSLRWTTMPAWYLNPVSVPLGARLKGVKDGGGLVFGRLDASRQYLYCLKGNNTSEFYAYDCLGDTWQTRESIPYSFLARKRVKKGAAITYDRYDSLVFALKGGGTYEFWQYHAIYRAWRQVRDIPIGLAGKSVKGGGSLTFWHQGTNLDWVYALKGNKTTELYAYHVTGDSWVTRNPVPTGLSNRGLGDGSRIAYGANGIFYIIKGNYNELYAYFADGDSYQTRKSLPLVGSSLKRKKAKDGTALCYTNSILYCLKGGTDEFWAYYPSADTWVQQLSIPLSPSGKPVKAGGSLAPGYGYIWALKGNKTSEFFFYDRGADKLDELPPAPAAAQGAVRNPGERGRLQLAPNPMRDQVRLSLPADFRPTRLQLLDITGRTVRDQSLASGASSVILERNGLGSGIYLLRLNDGGRSETRKLIVE